MILGRSAQTNTMLTLTSYRVPKHDNLELRTTAIRLKKWKNVHCLNSQDVINVNKTDKSQLLWQPVPWLKSAGEYAHVRVCSTTYCGRGRRNAANGGDEPCSTLPDRVESHDGPLTTPSSLVYIRLH